MPSPHVRGSQSGSGGGSTRQEDDIVVFEIVRDSACAECGEELGRGRWLRLEAERPLCLSCADISHLVFLPRGDAALTRRAGKHSRLRAVVVRFSRARKRYERQGILVEEAALQQAEEECLADSDARARARERRAEREAAMDTRYRADFARQVRRHYPGCPPASAHAIAEHACLKHSGRVGRTAAAKQFEAEAIDLAVRAHVRHTHTGYDELLGRGWQRHDARSAVTAEVEHVLERWRRPPRHRTPGVTALLLAPVILASGWALAAGAAPDPIGSALEDGTGLVYSSGGAAQAPWVYDSVRVVSSVAFERCVSVHRREQPTREWCARGDTLFEATADGGHRASRIVGPRMRFESRAGSGDLVRYETGDWSRRSVAGALELEFLPTTITTLGPDGAPVRRLREQYAPALLTALEGVFEEPDGAEGWRPVQEFALTEIRTGGSGP